VTRGSQHALLSFQTLGDLFTIIPCTSKELGEVLENEGTSKCNQDHDCAICIEGVVYGHDAAGLDYAE
jgi:snRNA-activating protein complex subunit 3